MVFLKMALLVLFVFIIPVLKAATELPAWHMKPLGSHVKADAVDEVYPENMISPEDFANKYVTPRKPIVFRNVVKNWPAYKTWTDEYLTEQYGDLELRLEAKKEKQGQIPKGDICLGRDTMKKFLQDYKQGADKYVVSELPTPMWHEVNVPPPMSCGDFLTNYVEIDLWINSDLGKKGKGGSSILHKDAFNTVNCVLNGTKEWKLIELKYNDYVYQSWEGPLDAGYGGFSLINTEKVNAKRFPNVGKIPNWQFTTINAGDCLYLPSQMWHQVKSYGETNRAVAFLFSQFNDVKKINTTSCKGPDSNLRLSDVDVDLQYPGKGPMSMGYDGVEPQREMLMAVTDRSGKITLKSVYRAVLEGHSSGTADKELMKEKTIQLYKHLLKAAGGDKSKMGEDVIAALTRDEVRYTFGLIQILDPNNALTHEYSAIVPEEITMYIKDAMTENKGQLTKEAFYNIYEENLGGTRKYADEFWQRLAGEKPVVMDLSKTIDAALRPHEKYRRDKPENDASDDDTITTPQGHQSRPKKEQGGYSDKLDGQEEDDEEEEEDEEDGAEGGQGDGEQDSENKVNGEKEGKEGGKGKSGDLDFTGDEDDQEDGAENENEAEDGDDQEEPEAFNENGDWKDEKKSDSKEKDPTPTDSKKDEL